jgi:hypothetical protein
MRLILLLFTPTPCALWPGTGNEPFKSGQSGLPAWHTCGLWWTEGASNQKL